MNAKDEVKLREINARLTTVKSTYEEMLAIYHQVHRRKLSLELNIKILENEKMDLMQGQLALEDFKNL